jgi:zinc finger protein
VFKITKEEDLNRRIIKSDSCTFSVPELDFEIPAQRGSLSTIEGIISTALDELSMLQPQRLVADPETYEKIDSFIRRGREYAAGKVLPFTVTLDDPAGNSWIDRFPEDVLWRQREYQRTPEQNAALGLSNPDAEQQAQEEDPIGPDEVHTFTGPCPSCTRPCATHMMPVDIPHFKEVIIMSTACEFCGYKSNEVKTGGEVPPMGRKITLKVESPDDLTRDILKVTPSVKLDSTDIQSETCSLQIPELHFDLQEGTLGGRFTTLEGLLQQAYEQLWGRVYNPDSDSSTPEEKDRFANFLEKMKDAIEGKLPFTLILDDPLSASYIQNLYAPDPDPNMTIEEYERTAEQNEDLGITELIAARAA